jgi:hypothetical protein
VIERRDAIRRNHQQIVADRINVAHFAARKQVESDEVGLEQSFQGESAFLRWSDGYSALAAWHKPARE